MIRPATSSDAAAVAAIYNHYVATTTIAFEEQPVAVPEMAQRIATVGAQFPWYVYEADGQVLGYAYATPWRGRSAYRHSAESPVYVAPDCGGRGIGSQLCGAVIWARRAGEVLVGVGGIARPKPASVALHERLGFEKVAHFRRVGRKCGQWSDVGYWELQLA